MEQSRDADDGTFAGDEISMLDDRKRGYNNPILNRLFLSCDRDARRTVHRAWAIAVLTMTLFSIIACVEATKLQKDVEGSLALEVAIYYTVCLHLIFVILGTFVLKRFATSFTVGCFLGTSVVLSQQNLLMFAAFLKYSHGDFYINIIFAYLTFSLFGILGFFSLLLGHYIDRIIEE